MFQIITKIYNLNKWELCHAFQGLLLSVVGYMLVIYVSMSVGKTVLVEYTREDTAEGTNVIQLDFLAIYPALILPLVAFLPPTVLAA